MMNFFGKSLVGRDNDYCFDVMSDKSNMWSKILPATVIIVFFPWSLLVMILLYGWDRALIILRELTAGRYVLIALLVVAVIILQFVVLPPL